MNKFTKILVMVVTCLAVGYLSSFATRSGMDSWFDTIQKPSFYPGASVFQPVWTILYIMMGVAAGLVWDQIEDETKPVRQALTFFGIQLALNGLWSVLFFGLQNPPLALIEIVILWLMIYETYIKFRQVNITAAWMMVPYLLWVTFATILNAGIWWLNK